MADEKAEKRLCGAKLTKRAGTCKRVAGYGTSHLGYGRCKNHSGSTPVGKTVADREMVAERLATYGGAVEISPEDALLQEVHRTAGHVAYLGTVVADLTKEELTGPVGSEGFNDQGITMHPAFKPSVWVEMYQSERAMLVRVCKAAIDAGIAERQVRIVERQGELFAEAIQGILGDLGVLHNPKTPEVVRRHLYALPSGA